MHDSFCKWCRTTYAFPSLVKTIRVEPGGQAGYAVANEFVFQDLLWPAVTSLDGVTRATS